MNMFDTHNQSGPRRERMPRTVYLLVLLLPPLGLSWFGGVSEFGSVEFKIKAAHFAFAMLSIIPSWLGYELFTYLATKVTSRINWPFWTAILIGVVITQLLHAPYTIIRDAILEPYLAPGSNFFETWPWNFGDRVYATEAALSFSSRLAAWTTFNVIIIYGMNFSRFGYGSLNARKPHGVPPLGPSEEAPAKDVSGIGRLYTRLSPSLGRRILYMSAQEHYTKICTDRGAELIHLSFSDAIALAQTAITGRRVHRSYWVAEYAVKNTEQEGSKLYLVLEDGARIPVSRSYRQSIQDWRDRLAHEQREESANS